MVPLKVNKFWKVNDNINIFLCTKYIQESSCKWSLPPSRGADCRQSEYPVHLLGDDSDSKYGQTAVSVAVTLYLHLQSRTKVHVCSFTPHYPELHCNSSAWSDPFKKTILGT